MVVGEYGRLILENMEKNYPIRKQELEVTGKLQIKIFERENELLNLKNKLEEKYKKQYPQPITKEIKVIAKYQQMIDSLVEEELMNEILKKI